ncbi:MAG: SprT-like domain-containing protein, partial [Nannocystaceae bacterium]
MLSIKRSREGVLTFRLHHMFIGAPAVVVRAAAHYAETHDRDSARLLHAYVEDNEEQIRQPDKQRAVSLDTEGRYHNLQEIFDELNRKYFEDAIEARITWGKRVKRRRSRDSIELGKYVFDDKLIRIHPVLDAEDVPRFFVASVVFHEMLHEVHGPARVDGRREYHPPQFRRDEERFEHYVEAVMWERTNARKLLER